MAHLVTVFDTRDRTGSYEVHTNGVIKVGVFDTVNNTVSLGHQTEAISMPLNQAAPIIHGIQVYVLSVMENIWNWHVPKMSSREVRIEFEHVPGTTELTTAIYTGSEWKDVSKYEIDLVTNEFTFKEAEPIVLGMPQYLYHDSVLTHWIEWAKNPNVPFIIGQ